MTEKKVFAFIRKNELILPGERVAAAVSGGADSVALLILLDRYRRQFPFSLSAVHVHHGIRGEEAERDQDYVKELCGSLGIPLTCYRYEVPALAAEWKIGEEEAGRIVRREAYTKEKKKIALGHHQNDVAETVLFHLCRGTGLRGMAAMQPEAQGMIRPLLCLTREEIESFLAREKIGFMTDSTNLQTDVTRNRIRHHILPVLTKEVNSETVAHISAAAERFSGIQRYLMAAGKKTLEACILVQDEDHLVLSAQLKLADPVEQNYALQDALERFAGSAKDLGAKHIDALRRLFDQQVGRSVSLPYAITAERIYEGVCLKKENPGPSDTEAAGEGWQLCVPGVTKTPLGTVKTRVFHYEGQVPEEKKYTKWLDYDKIGDRLLLRTRREGDYLRIAPQGYRKLLRRYFVDCKIPSARRARIPLVASGSHIAWIIGERISEEAKVTAGTENVLELIYEKE